MNLSYREQLIIWKIVESTVREIEFAPNNGHSLVTLSNLDATIKELRIIADKIVPLSD